MGKQTDCLLFGRNAWTMRANGGSSPWKATSRTLHQHHSHHHRKIPHLDPSWIHKTLEKHGKTDRLSTVWQDRLKAARNEWGQAMEDQIQDTSSASFSASPKDLALRSCMDTQNVSEQRQTVDSFAGTAWIKSKKLGARAWKITSRTLIGHLLITYIQDYNRYSKNEKT